ncbi:membrane-associated proteins in eicosanoid and glutathione metabolism [Leucogyrophana mollusca]|uniref:Membrane-associated proteins in eicosanoid and glutathione metabolism n=1 Tax=Leucogyrophana mollusca TaxID=85980 RepID=A0ACB8BXX0_9AGAM|nr:membrane-associated proteins in eicosanoid and glutathione metabolism [Leucogyrophana mollusca]
MSTSLLLPEGFAYVPSALMSVGWVLLWQTFLVGRQRKRSGIKYPQLYAEQAEVKASKEALRFNCAQRAHQNTLENVHLIAMSTLVAGLKHPLLASALCGGWAFSRVIYTLGYTTGEPGKRIFGALPGSVSMLALVLTASYAASQFLCAAL